MTSAVNNYPHMKVHLHPWREDFRKNGILYLLFLPVAVFFILFHYIPMVGIFMAFEDYSYVEGLLGSKWLGLQNFIELFEGDMFLPALRNTFIMSLFKITFAFIAPVLLALVVSQLRSKRYSRVVQTITYMPYFVSTVVVCSLAKEFLGYSGGITRLLCALGLEQQNWLANNRPPIFWVIWCLIEIWRGAGQGSIIYIAAIAGINGDLHEAAVIDGANRWQRVWKITFPCILPIVVMMFTLQVGLAFRMGYDSILLLYMPSTYDVADCLHTYTYRMAFGTTTNYSLSTASGLFQSVIATTLLIVSNTLNRKASSLSLF